MKRRIGVFLIIIGLILLVIFFSIDQSQRALPGLFFSGLGGVLIGGALAWHYREPPKPSERFRSVRKMMQDNKKNPEK
jgi:uncharacterized membrane protein